MAHLTRGADFKTFTMRTWCGKRYEEPHDGDPALPCPACVLARDQATLNARPPAKTPDAKDL